MNDQFTLSDRMKKITMAMMGVGLLALLLGLYSAYMGGGGHEAAVDAHGHAIEAVASADAHGHASETAESHGHDNGPIRFWGNLLINAFFFLAIGVAATFFIALQNISEASYMVVVKRIFEALTSTMGVFGGIMLLVFVVCTLDHHGLLYHWMNAEAVENDYLLSHKEAYLNKGFWWIRTLIYLGVWIAFARTIRKRSLEEDELGGEEFYWKNRTLSAGFMVFFGYSSSMASWDWLMSIDAHWFSTMFGWYIFSGMWISAIIMATLLVIYLKGKGYLEKVNASHIHDLGKWMFAISFLWTYLWFCQFMLIWYANVPEEVTYYVARINDYPWIYFIMIACNFVFPMLILMDRDNKRNHGLLTFVGIVIFFFHWVDVYMLVTPGTMKGEGHLGLMELGLFVGFLGLFLTLVFRALAKAPLMVKNHVYLDESIHMHH